MRFWRRPGQSLYVGPYRLTLVSTGEAFTRWQIMPTLSAPACTSTQRIYLGHRWQLAEFHLDPGETLYIAQITAIRLLWCSSRQVCFLVHAPVTMRILRGELVEIPHQAECHISACCSCNGGSVISSVGD
jgi:hypothetical protein